MTGRDPQVQAAMDDAARAELCGPEQAAQGFPEAAKTPGVCDEHKTYIRAAQIAARGLTA